MICSYSNSLWYDINSNKEVDIDELYFVENIKNLIADDED